MPGVEAGLAAGGMVMLVTTTEVNHDELEHTKRVYPRGEERMHIIRSLEDFKPEDWGLPAYDL